jgi:hypothetical protein
MGHPFFLSSSSQTSYSSKKIIGAGDNVFEFYQFAFYKHFIKKFKKTQHRENSFNKNRMSRKFHRPGTIFTRIETNPAIRSARRFLIRPKK